MACFEIKVMVICTRRKTDLFYFGRFTFGLHLFFLLLLLVQKFIIVNDLTNWRIGLRRDLYEIQLLLLGHFQGFLNTVHTDFYIITYQANLRYANHVVCAMFLLLFFSETGIEITSRLSRWKCHLNLLIKQFEF